MILDDIVADKRKELAKAKAETPLRELEARLIQRAEPLDFAAALRGNGVSIIAEVKKASPSKGLLCPDFDPVRLAEAYAEGGAAAISVLTEVDYFQGSLDYLAAIRGTAGLENVPLLRKDFIFEPYQVYEARAFGADAILLIAAILEDNQLERLLALAHELGMQCLVEVHDRSELERVVRGNAQIIGINNRDLRTFEVNINTTGRLRAMIPPDRVVVSESGVSRREDIEKLREWGVNAALIGEALVTADDIVARLKELV
jgi:indole-3-glycerol phosphate synthase